MSYRVVCLLVAHLLLGLVMGLGLPARAAEPAKVELAAWRVQTVVQDGVAKERLLDLAQLRPGDTVEYEATYSNTGAAKAGRVMLTLPVPDGGLVYLAGGAQPPGALASLDGKTYAAMPLMRAHTLPDGRKVQRAVPASEIRFLRWDLGDLPTGAVRSVRARMQLPALVAGAGVAVAVAANNNSADDQSVRSARLSLPARLPLPSTQR